MEITWLDGEVFNQSGDQTDETEYVNLVQKTGIQKKVSTTAFSNSIFCISITHSFGLANQTWLQLSLVDLIEPR